MHEIFNTLSYAKENTLSDEHMSTWGYESTKTMVKNCEEILIRRLGSVDEKDVFRFTLGEIHELYSLIDDGIPMIPTEIRSRMHHYLLECLFNKLDELAQLYTKIDT